MIFLLFICNTLFTLAINNILRGGSNERQIISFRVSKSEYEILKKSAQLENKELSQLILENALSRPVNFIKTSGNRDKSRT